LLDRPQGNPHWTDLSSDVRRKIVRRMAELLRQYRGTAANVETSERRRTVSDKIKPHHVERKAILYVRQSSTYQVQNNLES
jgi:hypothetical protein